MAEQIGSIEYSVRAETAQAIESSKQMEVALSGIEKSAKTTDASMKKLNTTMTATAKGVKEANSTASAVASTFGQLGQQVQDMAVQIAAGTSSLVVLGQQGPQIASIFGPGGAVVGAVVAVGAALLGMATSSDKASESIEDLAKSADTLGQAQLEDAINKANTELAKEQQTLVKLNADIERTEKAQKQFNLTTGVYAVKLTELRAAQEAQSNVVNQLVGNIERLNNAMNGSVDAAEKSRKATQEIVADLQFETQIMALSEEQRATAIAQRRAGVDAASAEGKAIEKAATAYVREKASVEASTEAKREAEAASRKAISSAESEQKKLESQYQANEDSLKRMAQQLSIAGLSTAGLAREAAELAAVYSLGEGANETQINQAKQLAGALFDLNEQKQKEKELESQKAEAKKFTEQVAFDAASPLQQIDIEEQAKLAKLAEYQKLGIDQEIDFQAAKTAIQKDAAAQRLEYEQATSSAMLGASSDMFGGLADLAGAFAGEQSSAYKALFAVSKGFAIANAALQLQTAIANAMAIPWPANIPAIAQAAALGAQVASNIAGISYGGGRQYGGPVSMGSMYRVGESNAPELLSSGGSNYLIPGSGGNVTPLNGGGGGVTFVVNNMASDTVQTQQAYDSETNTATLTIKEIARQIDSRTGDVGRAMKRAGAYNAKL